MKVRLYNHRAFIDEASTSELLIVRRECKTVFKRWNGREFQYEKTVDLYNEQEKSFPRSILWHLSDKLDEQGFDIELDDFTTPVTNSIKFSPKEEPELWDNQQKYLENLNKDEDGTGIVCSTTGTGKSRIIKETIKAKRCRTIIIVPTEAIRDGLAADIAEVFGAGAVTTKFQKTEYTPDKIQKKKKLTFYQELEAEEGLDQNPEMKYLLHKGFRKQSGRWKKLDEAKESKFGRTDLMKLPNILVICSNSIDHMPLELIRSFEMILLDEAHSQSESVRYLLDNATKAYWRYFYSGTLWRDRKEDMKVLLGTVSNKVIFEELPKDSIAQGRVSEIKYEMKKANPPKDPIGVWADKKGERVFVPEKDPDTIFKLGIICNTERNKQIVDDAIELYRQGRRVLISVNEEAHTLILKERFSEAGIHADTYFSDMDSKEKKKILNEASHGRNPGIWIGTYAIGIGVDTKNINAVIMADGRKSSIQNIQRKGRGIRKDDLEFNDLIVIDYFDWFHPVLLKHSKARYSTHKEYYSGNKSYVEKMFSRVGAKLHRL